jgi:quercetin dioxygenase-like cupin family protein
MGENRKGFIMSLAEAIPAEGGGEVKVLAENGQIQTIKTEAQGNPNMEVYPLLRPASVAYKAGKEPSINQWLTLEKIKPGGCLDPHYNEFGAGIPVFDISLYVISGRLRVTLGDIEKTVGPDTLIYIPSNVRHSVTNVGKGIVKYLAMKVVTSTEGERMGDTVYLKMPVWCQTEER